MEGGQTIKEESVDSPAPPASPRTPSAPAVPSATATTTPGPVSASNSPAAATTISTHTHTHTSSPSAIASSIPLGKENRHTHQHQRIASPASVVNNIATALLSASASAAGLTSPVAGGGGTAASEILTRSRSKVLSKDNSSHHTPRHHYHHHHHRMSESTKSGGGGSGHLRSRSPQSPPMPGIKNNSPANISSSTGSGSGSHHSSHSHNGGREREREREEHGFGHKYRIANGDVSVTVAGPTTPNSGGGVRSNRASPACGNNERRTPSPPTAGSNLNNSGSLARTQSSSSNSSGSSSNSSHHNIGESLAHLTNAGARHVMKIKRFLGTLLHFGCDISPEVGDRVRTLVFNLVSGHLSVEEFHHSLQEVTSFPLRPFVLPFLKTHLPLLQREISQLARISKQTPLSFIRTHEQVIIDSTTNIGEPCDIFHSEATDLVLPGKRKSSERDSLYENGERDSGESGYISTPKRPHTSLFSPSFFMAAAAAGGNGISTALDLREYYASAGYPLLTPISHHSHSHHHESSSQPGSGGGSGSSGGGGGGGGSSSGINNSSGSGSTPSTNGISTSGSKASEDLIVLNVSEVKNIHVMLNCILSMVEKTKRALSILQTRTFHGEEGDNNAVVGNGSGSSWLRRPTFGVVENSEDFKRQAGEMMAQALRATEDRVAEVKRRAEEAVQEVKRQALVELQRAVAAAEARACEAVANERMRLERAYLESRRAGEAGHGAGAPPIDNETCWNCGRKAHETCSGCNMARYCSSFCQHKDWEHHHTVCGRGREPSSVERANGAIDSKSCHGRENADSPPINVTNPSPDNVSSVGSNN